MQLNLMDLKLLKIGYMKKFINRYIVCRYVVCGGMWYLRYVRQKSALPYLAQNNSFR